MEESVPDKLLPTVLAYRVLEELKQSDAAAYKVWLILSNKFAAGQRL